jgi:hypothetical protein
MVLLGQRVEFKYCKKILAGAGIQTAALGFGGNVIQQTQQQQNNMMEQLGQIVQHLTTARSTLGGAGTSICRIRIWWIYNYF